MNFAVVVGRGLCPVDQRANLQRCRDKLSSSIEADGQPTCQRIEVAWLHLLMKEERCGSVRAGVDTTEAEDEIEEHHGATHSMVCLPFEETPEPSAAALLLFESADK